MLTLTVLLIPLLVAGLIASRDGHILDPARRGGARRPLEQAGRLPDLALEGMGNGER
jgi:hypothetical protein